MGYAKLARAATNAGLLAITAYGYGQQQSNGEIKVMLEEPVHKEESENRSILMEREIIFMLFIIVVIVMLYFLARFCRQQNQKEQIRIREV